MADSSSRSYRRDLPAQQNEPAQRDGLSDPLAELARLIGQRSEQGGNQQPPESYQDDAAPAPEFDWASVNEDERYAPGRLANVHDRAQEPEPWPLDQDYENEPAAPRQSLPAASSFNGARAEAPQRARSYDPRGEQPPAQLRTQPFPFIPPAQDDAHHADNNADQHGAYAGDYADDDYDDEPAPRRSGTVVIVALLGLAVLGTAGALGYRAVFGGSIIPELPPIIKPAEGPIRVKPAPNTAAGQADTGKSTGDQVVINQEQPVDIQSGNPIPRMIKTIPVVQNGSPDPGAGAQSPGVAAQVPPAGYAEPVTPSTPPFGASVQLPVPQLPPKQVRAPAPNAGAGRLASAPRPKPPVRTVAPESSSSGGPLSIVPQQEGAQQAAPRAVHTATNNPSASVPPAGATEAPAGGSGYAVQVSSQRSEAEAQAAYRALQAKYPQQFGSRHVVFRRADLGDKGIYFRALVGPFATAEQASGFCSSLKAAGGSCFTQRN
jgi:SPOR domain